MNGCAIVTLNQGTPPLSSIAIVLWKALFGAEWES